MKATFEVVALLSTVHGSWFPAHGLRQDGAELRARFYVGEWGVFHHVSVPSVNLARLGQA